MVKTYDVSKLDDLHKMQAKTIVKLMKFIIEKGLIVEAIQYLDTTNPKTMEVENGTIQN